MPRSTFLFAMTVLALGWIHHAGLATSAEQSVESLLQGFRDHSGADLVFQREDLPQGRYHDLLKPLDDSQRAAAAAICLEEAKRYPPGFFGEVGLKAVGIFATCVSRTTSDASRPFDEQLGGFRYFGVYNGTDAVAVAFYSEGQLSLTFHHEIFHHVDSTVDGETAAWQLSSDDAWYRAAITGLQPYKSPPISGDDLSALRGKCIGHTLKDAVSDYAAKNSREDQAETARHFMSMLPNSLVQVIDHPELAGSQRILHVMREYELSVLDGPGFDWFVDVALGRETSESQPETVDQLLVRMRSFAQGGESGYAGVANDHRSARAALKAAVRIKPPVATPRQSAEIVQLATEITESLLRQRIRPDSTQQQFDVWGQEDANGVNHTLRHDLFQLGSDAKRLMLIAATHKQPSDSVDDQLTLAHLRNLRLVSRYFGFIDSNWLMTSGTKERFEATRQTILKSLPTQSETLATQLSAMNFAELARSISEDGQPSLPLRK